MDEIYIPPGGPPQSPPPSREILALVGEPYIRKLLETHYEELGQSSIAGMFPSDLKEAANRSADFFIQLLGGQPYFSQKYGPPRMRARHMPFQITDEARQVWLGCFKRALDKLEFPAQFRAEFDRFLVEFSAWMVNRKSPS